MMKKAFVPYLLFTFVGCGVLAPPEASAQKILSEHLPTDRMLEFSLTRLKESVQKTLHKNDRLSFENDVLRQSIGDLLREKETLLRRRNELLGLKDAHDDPGEEEHRLRPGVNDEARKARVQELIAVFQEDNRQLEEKVAVKDRCLDQEEFADYKKGLSEREKRTGKDLLEAQKELEVLKKRNQGPEEQIEELERIQHELAREREEIQYKMNSF